MYPGHNNWHSLAISATLITSEPFMQLSRSFLPPFAGCCFHPFNPMLSNSFRFAAVLFFCNGRFQLYQRFSVRFRSGLIGGQFKMLHLFLFNHSFLLMDVGFGLLYHWKSQDLSLKPSFLKLGHILVKAASVIFWFCHSFDTFIASGNTGIHTAR